MVGVPGKYKGCETCRLRRVKCDNQRPFCRKCIDGGRECAGYERETVFIIGTIEDQGRCSSHPPRVVKPKKGKTARAGGDEESFELVPTEPLRPAWDGLISVSCRGRSYRLQAAALYTDLQGVTRAGADSSGDEADSRSVFVSLPPFDPPDVQPGLGEDDFRLGAQCLVHLATPDEEQGGSRQTATDNICLFLYEHNTSSYFSNQPYWKDPSSQTNPVRRLGPEHFRTFPAHHFFARVYRPNAIMTALLNRTPTHLGEPHWQSTPFEYHPKSPLDNLLDTLAVLPALLARADRVLAQPHTLTRRLMAQDLLHNCLDLELELGRWYAALSSPSSSAGQPQPHRQHQQPPPPPFWLAPNLPAHHTPFPHPLAFRDNPTALALTYHWTALVLFYPTIWRLYFAAVIDPVLDDTATTRATTPSSSSASSIPAAPTTATATAATVATTANPSMGMSMGMSMGFGTGMATGLPHDPSTLPLPPRLQALDPMAYSLGKVREAAANACRGLDFLVSAQDGENKNGKWVQPDLLWHPLFVASRFYAELGGLGGLGGLGIDAGGEMGMGMGLGLGVEGVGGDGRLEMMWCEGCRQRLVARGGEMREVVVGGRGWVDVASF